MIVGGGIGPATNFTRHDVQRPRPPQVAVMSTPAAWAALRIETPGVTGSARRADGIARVGEDGQENGHVARFYPGPLPIRAATGYPPPMESRDPDTAHD